MTANAAAAHSQVGVRDETLGLNMAPKRSKGSPHRNASQLCLRSSVQGQAAAYQHWPRVQAAMGWGVNAARALMVTYNPAVTAAGRVLCNGGRAWLDPLV